MKFTLKTLEEFYRSISFSSRKDYIIICLIYLYHANKINRSSLLSQYNNIINGKSNMKRNTYHSKVNGIWYNDMGIDDIYNHILDTTIPLDFEISFDDMVNHLNLITGKRKNMCVILIMDTFIKPLMINLINREPSSRDIEYYFNKYFNHKLDEIDSIDKATTNNITFNTYDNYCNYDYEKSLYNKPVVNNYIKKKLHKYAKTKLTGKYWLNPLYVETTELDYSLYEGQHIFDYIQPLVKSSDNGFVIKKKISKK